METKFSVIIPTYNRANTIGQAIQSVLAQTYGNYEIIVVDDGSSDNTEEVVRNIKSPKLLYYKKENGERAAARNFGIKKANGNYISFLDSDDVLYENHLEVASQFIKEKNNPEIINLAFDMKNADGKVLALVDKMPPTVNSKLIYGNTISCNGVLLRKDIAENNLFNEDRILSASEDWELWLRIASQYPIHSCGIITSTIVNHVDRSVLNFDYKKLINRFEVFLKYVLSNKEVVDYYKGRLHILKASCNTYIALHIALIGNHRKIALKYLGKGIREYPQVVFTRRFIAVLKHIVENK